MTVNRTGRVRALTRADRDVWAALWTDYLEFYNSSVEAPVYASTFDRLLGTDPQDFNALVYELDGKVVGLAHFLFHRHAWKIEQVCYLQDLYVSPDARGTGAGRALIEAVYAAADHAKSPTVYWLTQEFNETARQLYDRIGSLTPFIKYQRA